jgi:hypothetical protein
VVSGDERPAAGPGPLDDAVAAAAVRLALSLVAGLLATAPALLAVVDGRRDLGSAALWFVAAFLLARAGVAVVWSVWSGYRASIDRERAERDRRRREELREEAERRRAAEAAQPGEAAPVSVDPADTRTNR